MPVLPMGPDITWDELVNTGRSGDVLLFAGESFESSIIEAFTSGPYSHAAMLVRDDTNMPMLWQANPTRLANNPSIGGDTHHALPEGLTDHAGVQIGYLDQALNTIALAGDTAYYRPLDGDRPDGYDAMLAAVMKSEMGKPFGSLSHMAWAYAEGQLGIDAGTDSYFCSQLVAHTYQHTDLLSTDWPANSYAPNDFDMANELTLLAGTLGATRKVAMDTVPGHGQPPVDDTSASGEAAAAGHDEIQGY